ncbi:unnamed protein product [Pleuronectes platessa]|uniref:Uncharacterized protein n=1 Tax=Pleuronectes platessa TaxID=8262 RepID=A0A9N7VA10_PLEPL|nr:unnamed protein product [Pleuronectes platessa]
MFVHFRNFRNGDQPGAAEATLLLMNERPVSTPPAAAPPLLLTPPTSRCSVPGGTRRKHKVCVVLPC